MNGFEYLGTIMLIHDRKVREEMEHDRRERPRGEYVPRPRGDEPGRLRIALSRGLIAVAHRIAPADSAKTGFPAGAPH